MLNYDTDIRGAYDATVLSSFDLEKDQINWDKLKGGLSKVVSLLRQGHLERIVETVEGLPTPEQVLTFDEKTLARLKIDLMDRYFPIIGINPLDKILSYVVPQLESIKGPLATA